MRNYLAALLAADPATGSAQLGGLPVAQHLVLPPVAVAGISLQTAMAAFAAVGVAAARDGWTPPRWRGGSRRQSARRPHPQQAPAGRRRGGGGPRRRRRRRREPAALVKPGAHRDGRRAAAHGADRRGQPDGVELSRRLCAFGCARRATASARRASSGSNAAGGNALHRMVTKLDAEETLSVHRLALGGPTLLDVPTVRALLASDARLCERGAAGPRRRRSPKTPTTADRRVRRHADNADDATELGAGTTGAASRAVQDELGVLALDARRRAPGGVCAVRCAARPAAGLRPRLQNVRAAGARAAAPVPPARRPRPPAVRWPTPAKRWRRCRRAACALPASSAGASSTPCRTTPGRTSGSASWGCPVRCCASPTTSAKADALRQALVRRAAHRAAAGDGRHARAVECEALELDGAASAGARVPVDLRPASIVALRAAPQRRRRPPTPPSPPAAARRVGWRSSAAT